jgi:hypothetical protein
MVLTAQENQLDPNLGVVTRHSSGPKVFFKRLALHRLCAMGQLESIEMRRISAQDLLLGGLG